MQKKKKKRSVLADAMLLVFLQSDISLQELKPIKVDHNLDMPRTA
jgi:hypothetical protein